jgi:hypothetical protein
MLKPRLNVSGDWKLQQGGLISIMRLAGKRVLRNHLEGASRTHVITVGKVVVTY